MWQRTPPALGLMYPRKGADRSSFSQTPCCGLGTSSPFVPAIRSPGLKGPNDVRRYHHPRAMVVRIDHAQAGTCSSNAVVEEVSAMTEVWQCARCGIVGTHESIQSHICPGNLEDRVRRIEDKIDKVLAILTTQSGPEGTDS